MRTLDETTDPSDRKAIQDIAQVGWHVTMVPEDNEGPGFAYTTGLFVTHGHPELVIFGPPLEAMFEMLNALGTAVANGETFTGGEKYELFADGRSVAFVPFPQAEYQEYLGVSVWFYKGSQFAVLQVMWPDKRGYYPTDGEFDRRLRGQQPLPGR